MMKIEMKTATQGIGLAIAERLGLEGASVVISSRKQKNVDEAAEKLKNKGLQVLGLVCHVSNAQQRKDLIQNTAEEGAPRLQKSSSVVLISSIAGFRPVSGMAMYGVNKTALFGLTKMSPDTRVNCVAPGLVPTRFAACIANDEALRAEFELERRRRRLEESTLLQRLGTPEDMAAATAFLTSADACYITGETLLVAGGLPSRL